MSQSTIRPLRAMSLWAALGMAAGLLLIGVNSALAAAPGATITYQGQLKNGQTLSSGSYDIRFILYNAAEGGNQVGPILTKEDLAVTGGQMKADLDFGSVFGPEELWMEVSLRDGSSTGAYTPLAPRQRITASPYALSTPWAGLTGIPAGFLDGTDNDTTYAAGTGVTLTGNQFNVAFGGNGAATQASRIDHHHNGNYAALSHTHPWTALTAIPAGFADGADADTTYTAGTGLTLTGTKFDVAFGGTGAAATAARSDHTQPWSTITGLPAGFADGTDADTTYTAGAGLTLNGTAFGVNFAGSGAAATAARSDHDHSAFWRLGGNAGIDPATQFMGTTDAQPFLVRVNNQTAFRIFPSTINANNADVPGPPNMVGGYRENEVAANIAGAVIAGGGTFVSSKDKKPNVIRNSYGVIGGGFGNKIEADASQIPTNGQKSVIGGGAENTVAGESNVIAGGNGNSTRGNVTVIGGGVNNRADETAAVVAGGSNNWSSGVGSTVGGGVSNVASGYYSIIPGGHKNRAEATGSSVLGYESEALGLYSLALGYHARAKHAASFVWADSSDGFNNYLETTANFQFIARAAGGTKFFSNSAATTGVSLAAGGGSWANLSDVNSKTAFSGVDGRSLLNRLEKMPIRTWQYKSQDAGVRHIGPTAQDFHAAFKVGEDERHITTVDADGVALAAIQELTRQLRQKETRLDALQKENAAMTRKMVGLKGKNAEMESRLKALEQWAARSEARNRNRKGRH